MQRRAGKPEGFELLCAARADPRLCTGELEVLAVRRLEVVRIATRVAPMLGLVATMIPMGPALKSLGDGRLADVSQSLTVAFSAVILALLASAITYWIANVRRRWYAGDLLDIGRRRGHAPSADDARGGAGRGAMKLGLLDDMEDDDPILSVVNLIDVFLVIIAALLLAVANNPLNPFVQDQLTIVKNAAARTWRSSSRTAADQPLPVRRRNGPGARREGRRGLSHGGRLAGVRAGIERAVPCRVEKRSAFHHWAFALRRRWSDRPMVDCAAARLIHPTSSASSSTGAASSGRA